MVKWFYCRINLTTIHFLVSRTKTIAGRALSVRNLLSPETSPVELGLVKLQLAWSEAFRGWLLCPHNSQGLVWLQIYLVTEFSHSSICSKSCPEGPFVCSVSIYAMSRVCTLAAAWSRPNIFAVHKYSTWERLYHTNETLALYQVTCSYGDVERGQQVGVGVGLMLICALYFFVHVFFDVWPLVVWTYWTWYMYIANS